MVARMIPLSQQIYFEVDTEDFMTYRRPVKTKSKEASGSKSQRKALLGKRSLAQ
jgi:hypothetical protein